jgi:hypothetical protein
VLLYRLACQCTVFEEALPVGLLMDADTNPRRKFSLVMYTVALLLLVT